MDIGTLLLTNNTSSAITVKIDGEIVGSISSNDNKSFEVKRGYRNIFAKNEIQYWDFPVSIQQCNQTIYNFK